MDANESTSRIPILIDANEAAELLSISRATFLRLDRSGRLGPRSVKLGRLVRWHRAGIEAWALAGCPPRSQWHTYGLPHGGSPDSGKPAIARPAGQVTSRSKIRNSHGGEHDDRN